MTASIYDLTAPVGQASESGLQSCEAEGSSGVGDLFPRWLICMTGCLVQAVGRRSQLLTECETLHSMLERLHDMRAGFPQNE